MIFRELFLWFPAKSLFLFPRLIFQLYYYTIGLQKIFRIKGSRLVWRKDLVLASIAIIVPKKGQFIICSPNLLLQTGKGNIRLLRPFSIGESNYTEHIRIDFCSLAFEFFKFTKYVTN